MHRLRIVNGKVYLDDKEIIGITKIDLHLDAAGPIAMIEIELDPQLFIDQTCNNPRCN